MSEDQNIPAEESADDGQRSTEENAQSLSESQLQTTNYQLQTENMEVHKHPHHVTHKKKWTEYFLEFFMLFLAVFLGFVAENWREHIVERHREKEYMINMIEDLRSDTAEIQYQIKIGTVMAARADSLVNLLNNEPMTDVPKLYGLTYFRIVRIVLEDRTSSQLKNAGGMRLILNKKVADTIREYWNINKVLENISTRLEEIAFRAQGIGTQLFNNKYFIRSNKEDAFSAAVSIDPAARLIDNDPKLLAQFSNWRSSHNFVLRNYIRNMREAKLAATGLIDLIKKEYHLE